jgi:lariat debranching enzyme
MPAKYRQLGDFHEYYSGARKAPFLTIFIGGNHEASNYLTELYYGGWVAPNIYYAGAANVLKLGSLRIAAMSGIWKNYDFRKPHHERLPYNDDEVKSIFHVRELDTRKLLQIRTPVDVGLSHDWPRGIVWKGNHRELFRKKSFLEEDAQTERLGSVAAKLVLGRTRPQYWLSAHLHVKYAATFDEEAPNHSEHPSNGLNDSHSIDEEESDSVAEDQSEQLVNHKPKLSTAEPPSGITNRTTRFLSLDKCLPNRDFLQLLEVKSFHEGPFTRPLRLQYDKEWLAITRVFADHLSFGDPSADVPVDKGQDFYKTLIENEERWVEENLVQTHSMDVPDNFVQTAPISDPIDDIRSISCPREYSNPQTKTFCELLQIPNVFDAPEEELLARAQTAARPSRGGHRGSGRGRGLGRGNFGRRGRGRGRSFHH